MRHLKFIGLAGIAILGVAGWWFLQSGNAAETGPSKAMERRAVPVEVATVDQHPMPVEITTIGRVQTVASVAIKARIDGVVQTVNATDGQEVKAGDILFTLDDRALQAGVRQAEAALARDRAQLENAKREVERQQPLIAKDYVPRATMDQLRTNAAALEGTVRSDEAQLELTKVQLSYTMIRAPIDGRLGTIAYKVGNQVRMGDTTPLVVLNRITPIYVAMSIPQTNYAAMQRALNTGAVSVRANVPGDQGPPVEGKLAYIENAIDTTSNTLSVKSTFPNTDRRLWPGQFVNATVVMSIEANAVTIPAEAVQAGQAGNYVYVVKDGQAPTGKSVEARTVEVDRTIEGQAVVAKGLKPGELVVINGQLRLDDGMPVTIKMPDGKPPAAAPAQAGKSAS